MPLICNLLAMGRVRVNYNIFLLILKKIVTEYLRVIKQGCHILD